MDTKIMFPFFKTNQKHEARKTNLKQNPIMCININMHLSGLVQKTNSLNDNNIKFSVRNRLNIQPGRK